MQKNAEQLVAEYRRLPASSDALGDCSENDAKTELISSMDDFANADSVGRLLHDIICDTKEFDLARIEAMDVTWVYVDGSSEWEQKLKLAIWTVFSNTEDDTMVRQHAAAKIGLGYGGQNETSIIETILFDDDDDESVRHGAFSYMGKTEDWEFVGRVLPLLKKHEYWSKNEILLSEIEARHKDA